MKSTSAWIVASAILLAAAGTASAKPAISFNGSCDGLIDIQINGAELLAIDDLKTGCGQSTDAYEVETVELISGSGKYITFAENTLEAEGVQGYAMYLAVQIPLRTGNHWFNAYTKDGKTVHQFGYLLDRRGQGLYPRQETAGISGTFGSNRLFAAA